MKYLVVGRQSVMGGLLTPSPPADGGAIVDGEAIMQEIAQQFGVTLDELRGPCRKQALVDVRRLVAKRLAAEGLRRTDIAEIMHRDHSSVFNLLHRPGNVWW